ncbi:MAG: hypothetical protein IPM39_27285 [Chloroflexi bacterium]|nr:hypothetical protein [Chloroflexota bacterium]
MHENALHQPKQTDQRLSATDQRLSATDQRLSATDYQPPATSRLLRRVIPMLLLMVVVLAGCAEGEAPPPAICDTYDRGLYTAQLMGGALLILAVAILGFKKQAAAIISPPRGRR